MQLIEGVAFLQNRQKNPLISIHLTLFRILGEKIPSPLPDFPCNWSNPCKIEIMLTFLIEMLELPNFGHIDVLSTI